LGEGEEAEFRGGGGKSWLLEEKKSALIGKEGGGPNPGEKGQGKQSSKKR